MPQRILKDLYVPPSVLSLEKYYDQFVPVDLWRAVRKNQRILEPRVERRQIIRKGCIIGETPIDIETYDVESRSGLVKFVNCYTGGVSTFDRKVELSGEFWIIPKKTPLPNGLVVTEDNYNKTFHATHYSIKAEYDMPLAEFRKLLDILAEYARPAIN